MSNVVNLNKFRKAKAKVDKSTKAEENRVRHGRTKAEKAKDTASEDKDRQRHEGHELDGKAPDPEDKDPA